MFCTNCGRELRDDMKFCPDCGTKVEVFDLFPEKAAETAEELAEPVAEAAEEVAGTGVETAEEIAEPVAEAAEEIAEAAEATAAEVADVAEETAEEAAEFVEGAATEVAAPVIAAAEEVAADATPIADVIAAEAAPIAEGAAAAEEPPKKKSKAPLIIVLVLVVLAAAGYFIYQNLDSTKYAKLRKQIDAAMEQKDYAAAQPLIEEAFQYERDTEDLQEFYRQCKLDPVLALAGAEDQKGFITAAEAHIKEYPKSEEELLPLIETAYKSEADKVLGTNDLAQIKELRTWLASAYDSGKYPGLKDKIKKADDLIEYLQLKQTFAAFAADLQKTMTPTETYNPSETLYVATFDCIRDGFLKGSGKYRSLALSEEKMKSIYPLILDKDANGRAWAFYYTDDRYFFYYGGFNGTKREGEGIWICADNLTTSATWREYLAKGTWKDDLPNGTFTEYRRTKYTSSEDLEMMLAQANVKNGLYEGEVQLTYSNSKLLKGTFKDGHPVIIDTIEDANGEKRDIIFISEDGQQYISIPHGTVQTRGIYGFAK